MARFIVDIANLSPQQIKEVCEILINVDFVRKAVSKVVCIDESNEGQFEDENSSKANRITKQQIKNFNANYPI